MLNTILASTALLATTALAQNIGSAIVINSCNYPVYLTAVPASGGGQNQIGPNTLQTGQSFTQEYTQLTNGDGWSIKLTQSQSASSLMQYEYTYQNDGTLWFDMSDVNGDPWGGNWVFTATGDCTPKQTAYQYSTDDAYGMQSCPDTSSVTVELCGSGSGSSTGGSSGGNGGGWGSSPSAGASTSSPTQAPASAAPESSANSAPYIPSAASVAPWQPNASGAAGFNQKAAVSPSQASTMATVVSQAPSGAHTVTNVHTVVVTEYVTASPVPAPAQKRHEHLHRHMAHHH